MVRAVVEALLNEHFPESIHADILATIGLEVPESSESVATRRIRRRDPNFRRNILRAYEHRCAVTGFRAALGGSYVGCEAAHVLWHAFGGPDTVDNGLAVEPTLHKLFDLGAWTLTDDRRVLISAELTGTDETTARIRRYHGMEIRSPLVGVPLISVEYIRWHREPEQGGVFKYPALPL